MNYEGLGKRTFLVLKPWGPYERGDTIKPTGVLRDQYVQLGFIREIDPNEIETATLDTNKLEKTTTKKVVRRRGRPRKAKA